MGADRFSGGGEMIQTIIGYAVLGFIGLAPILIGLTMLWPERREL